MFAKACRKQAGVPPLRSHPSTVLSSGLKGATLPVLREASATKAATSEICRELSFLPNDGMPLPPTRTWCSTVVSSGFSSSRFGPTWPLASAAFSVWQLPQPELAKTLPPGELALPPELPQPAASGSATRRKAVAAWSFMTRCLGTIALWP